MKKHKLVFAKETLRQMQPQTLAGVVGGLEVVYTHHTCAPGGGTTSNAPSIVARCGIPNPSEICGGSLLCGGGGTGGSLTGG